MLCLRYILTGLLGLNKPRCPVSWKLPRSPHHQKGHPGYEMIDDKLNVMFYLYIKRGLIDKFNVFNKSVGSVQGFSDQGSVLDNLYHYTQTSRCDGPAAGT